MYDLTTRLVHRQYTPRVATTIYNRTAVIVRDPREVVMSERRMRIEVFNTTWVKELPLNDFVLKRFEVGRVHACVRGTEPAMVVVLP